jgi:phage protein D
MDTSSYEFDSLEKKYGGFAAPGVEVSIGGTKLDAASVPLTDVSVTIDAGSSAGGATVAIGGMYDAENSKWSGGLQNIVKIGAKLIISLGYASKKQVFQGFIDDFTVAYTQDQSTVSMTGIDAKAVLMNASGTKYFSQEKSRDIIQKILSECTNSGYAAKIDLAPPSEFTDFKVEFIQSESSDYKILCALAEMNSMNFFIVNGEIIFKKVMTKTDPIITLTLGPSLISFTRTLSLRNQVGEIIVRGFDKVKNVAIKGSSKDTPIGNGKSAKSFVSSLGKKVREESSDFVTTPEECTKLAQSLFDRQAMDFVSGSGRCIGLPELIPGRYIKLEGMDSISDGVYFISKVRHTISSGGGYFTDFDISGAKSN